MLNNNAFRVGILLLFVIFSLPVFSQKDNNPWQDVSEFALNQSSADRQIVPEKYRTVSLENEMLNAVLAAAPLRHTPEAETTSVILYLPMPDGTEEAFRIVDAPIMAPDLAVKYPAIHAYAGQGIDDPTAYVRFGVTQKGFHAMILSARHSTVFIDAYAKNDTENYISYYKTDYAKRVADDFSCHTEGQTKQDAAQQIAGENLFKAGGDCQLRDYRLALACTREYASFHGGTIPSVLAEYNIAMARVNGVYETDFAVTMTLIGNTDDLIFLAEPDPYTNNNGGAMLGQNQTTCDNVIGSANYDIGHVFSTGGGGIAGLGVPCRNNQKARGVTGLGSPVNDPFYIDYVAHEIGHQFGANHTFNNSCGGNRNNSTAMEPGSASTIMGYAGICPPNVQSNSDPYFHAISLIEVYNYITVGSGSGCPSVINNPNSAPVLSVANTGYVIPASTPFQLTATATDVDGGALTYCWEQMDNEISTQSPLGTNSAGPNFRSLNPAESPTRYFPSIDNILNGTADAYEVLPTVSRDMNFRCVVRDNNMGEGCTDEADVEIEVDGNSGPFLVTNPNTNLTWTIGENQPVNWDVANTDQAPVSCANVDILLSLDGGNTYPITLASNVPNTGTFTVSVPNNATTTARVMVTCSDNIFLDISDQNFTIDEPAVPTFAFTASPTNVSACNDATASYTFDFASLAGFNEPVNLTTAGLPAGATASFSVNPITPSGMSTLTVSNLGSAAAGTYTITVNANSTSINNSTTVDLIISAGIPQIQNLVTPTDNETGVSILPSLTWDAVLGASGYNIIVSTSPDFAAGSIVFDGNSSVNSILTNELNAETVYYWQVNATSDCGTGTYSTASAFQTGAVSCNTYNSTNVPIILPIDAAGSVTSTLDIPGGTIFTDVDVNIFIRHTWVGDLGAVLTSPNNTSVQLFAEPGSPASQYGCNGDDVNVTINDDAGNTAADFEDECGGGIPSIAGNYQPIDALSVFNGADAGGTWTLTISDAFGEDGGLIDSWSIFGCSADGAAPPAPTLSSNILNVPQGESETITNAFLQASDPTSIPAQLTFTVLSLPANGTLTLNGSTLVIGSTYTQADIDSGALAYTHNNTATTTDSFDYSVTTAQGGWLPEGTFNINIIQNSLSATAAQNMGIACNGESNGSITATAVGGNEPLSYSIDGMNFQASNVFPGLNAGSYTITVRDNFDFEQATNVVTLDDPAAISANNVIDENTITVDAMGGTGDLTYSIDGINFQASNVFSDLENGVYEVCVKDENDCQTCKNETIAVNNVTATAVISTQISCSNENDGVITVTPAGGNEPYSYSINGGTAQPSNVFSFLPSNDYTITVTDNDGFSFTTSTVTLSNPSQIISTVNVDGSDITVSASGGTGDLMYTLNGGTPQASNVFAGLDNGSYTVCAIDMNDCEMCENAVIAVNMMVVNAVLDNDISCNDANDATITVNAAGGTEPYMYALNGGTPQMSNTFDGLNADAYIITVTDNDGFVLETNSITVSNPTAISVANAVTDNTITITAAGGTGDLSYTIDGSTYQSSNIFAGLENGTYQACARDENNCEVCETAIVAVNGLIVTATLDNDISCNNANDAMITVNAAGGMEPYLYALNGGTPQASNTFEGLSADDYIITVTDNDGFVLQTNSVTISNPTAISVANSVTGTTITITAGGGTGDLSYTIDGTNYQASNVFMDLAGGTYQACARDENDCEVCETATIATNSLIVSAILNNDISCNNANDATITVNAAGGTEPYMYALNGGTPQASNVFEGLSADDYIVTVIDNDGFTLQTNSVTISNPTVISVANSVTDNTITVTADGGTGDLSYTIDGMNYQSSNVFTDLENGTYQVCVQDENDCEVCETAIVATNGLLVSVITNNGISCNNANDAMITASAAGGNEPYFYSLNGTGTPQASNVFSDLEEGMYFVEVTDSDGFVLTTNVVTIVNPTLLTATADANAANVTVNADGGTAGYQYSIDGVNYVNNNVFIFEESGTYTLFVQDANGCVTTVEAVVDITQIAATASVQTAILCTGGADGCLSVSIFNAVAPVQYELNGTVQTDDGVFCGLSAGEYTVNITDANGLMTSAMTTIENPAALNFAYEIDCNFLTTTVSGGTGDLVITLNNEAVIESEIEIINGEYLLSVTDENGCTMSDNIVIDTPESFATTAENVQCFGEANGTISVNLVEGGTGDFEYSLDDGEFQSSPFFGDLAADTYTITVRDAEGCMTFANVVVTQSDQLELSAVVDGTSVIATATGGTGDLMYSLDGENFQDSNVFVDLPAGIYTVIVQDENGCTTEADAEIISSINDVSSDLDFAVNPNPNSGTFNLLVNMPTERDLIVRIFDVAGKEIFRNVYLKNGDFFTQNISLTNLAAGSYFVTVNDGTLAGTKEIIVVE